MKQVYIYKRFERFWHWTQALLIIFLAVTGFEIHDSIHLFGFEKAVEYHRVASYMLLALIGLSIFWHITTGEWRQYIPTTTKLKEQLHYYAFGMFKNAPHPTIKSVRKKLNPLQAIVYLGFKVVMAPLVVFSGILYLSYKTFDANSLIIVGKVPLEVIALIHTFGAFLLIAFIIIHVYMTTTGHKVTTNIKAMLTGWEDVNDDYKEDTNTNSSQTPKTENHE